ncbi:hypothetical protein E2C01_090325 [Portunus trituberculatus]|uniref:Uncharacterized protein n=1 Tax=Portunus trituberculatus TaxID=210409 RepID=A0A5B7JJY9_PORTR|nr:hypothetical protein [Portunus trituberculatus]
MTLGEVTGGGDGGWETGGVGGGSWGLAGGSWSARGRGEDAGPDEEGIPPVAPRGGRQQGATSLG